MFHELIDVPVVFMSVIPFTGFNIKLSFIFVLLATFFTIFLGGLKEVVYLCCSVQHHYSVMAQSNKI